MIRLKNDRSTYGVVAKTLHWLLAAAILGMIVFGYLLANDHDHTPARITLIGIHKAIGVLILITAMLRLGWRFYSPPPALPERMTGAERALANLSHWALYAFMLGVPLIGILMSQAAGYAISVFGWFILPTVLSPDRPLAGELRSLHGYAAYTMLGLIAAHAGAALLHFFHFRDRVLQRMMPFGEGAPR